MRNKKYILHLTELMPLSSQEIENIKKKYGEQLKQRDPIVLPRFINLETVDDPAGATLAGWICGTLAAMLIVWFLFPFLPLEGSVKTLLAAALGATLSEVGVWVANRIW